MSTSAAILGHKAQLAALEQDLTQGNVAHAYLFSGPRHVGKFTIAKLFARRLLTEHLDGDERTQAEERINRLFHPDLFVIDQLWIEDICEDAAVIARSSNVSQIHRSKSRAKTDTIGIHDIHALQERLHEVGTAPYRCCLIRSVDRMQPEAVNAILKILEEPPQGLVFLLTTQALPTLLPTLISRTRTMHFFRLNDADLEPFLHDAADEDRNFLIRVAQGAPGVIRRLRDNPDFLRQERQVHSNALAFWHSRSPTERMQLLSPMHERTAAAEQFLLHLSLAYREERETLPDSATRHLLALQRNLETNVNRQLLAQQFVLALTSEA